MNNGFILLHRKLLDNWIFDNPEYFRAWVAILMSVNHAEKKVLIKGDLITCKRGESLKSIESWCKLFARDWTRQKVRTFFKLLEKDQMINQQGLLNTTKLSVCNYGTYQSKQPTDNQRTNQQITNGQPTDNQRVTTNNNDNNANNDKKKSKEDRAKEFATNTKKLITEKKIQISESEANNFIEYWCETGINDLKLRFEKERTFGLSRRLSTWMNNNFSSNNTTKQQGEPKLQFYKGCE